MYDDVDGPVSRGEMESGTIENVSRDNVRLLLIVAAFAAFAACAGLWSLPPIDRDESRFAQATAQMIESDDYLVIRFQDRERNKKPAGIYWLQAASVSVLSDVEKREIWAYRIPSVAGAILAAIFTFLIGKNLYDQRTAFLAALLIASAPVTAVEATVAKTDSMLLALICAAQFAFVKVYAGVQQNKPAGLKWPITFWAAQSAAILVKGPVAPIVSVLTGVGLLSRNPRTAWITRMRPVLGVLILITLITPWALAIGGATEGRFFSEAMGGDLLSKIASAQESHAGPPGYHLLLVWILFWPAAALLAPGLFLIWRERDQWQARFLLSWVIPAWVVFEFTATKLPHYVLPLYPALAIIAARAATRPAAPTSAFVRPGALLYGVVSFVAAGFIVALPALLEERSLIPASVVAAGFVGVASLFITSLFWRGRSFQGGIAASGLAAAVAWIVLTGIMPALTKPAISSRLSAALEEAARHPLTDDALPVALAGYSEPSAVFLLGTDTVLTSGADAASKLISGEISAAIIDRTEQQYFLSHIDSAQTDVHALAEINGLNYSNGQRVSLSIFVRDTSN